MAFAIVVRGSRVGQPARVVGGFADLDEAEAYVALTNARHQVFRKGDERYRTGDLLAAEYLDVKEAVKAQGPGFAKRLKEAVEDRVGDRAEQERRKAEQLEQRARQREAERREAEIRAAVEQKRAAEELEQIRRWREEAESELAGAT